MTSTPWNGNSIGVGVFSESALRGRGGGGGGRVWIFSGTTQCEVAETSLFEHNDV